MREIKFRGYAKEIKLLCDVSFVDFELKIVRLDVGKLKDTEWCYQDEYNFDDIELLEYTGLKDKNGIAIFEGDIVYNTSSERNHEVKYVDCYWTPFTTYYQRNCLEENQFEVIGNIHEDPELLKD